MLGFRVDFDHVCEVNAFLYLPVHALDTSIASADDLGYFKSCSVFMVVLGSHARLLVVGSIYLCKCTCERRTGSSSEALHLIT